MKAGKSTLLNALVGERLAATDAGECTRVVTWYRHALGYRVDRRAAAVRFRELAFHRSDGALEIDLGGIPLEAIERIEVGWPSKKLADLTLIDTPGLGSATRPRPSGRCSALLDGEADGPGDADAVLYLMRHLHRSDVAVPRGVHGSLDRPCLADQRDRGALPGRRDRGRTAGRARLGPGGRRTVRRGRQVRELASGVVPVAGLIAETGATLREGSSAG